MITVTAGGVGLMSDQSMGEMEKDFCPNLLQPFLENINRRNCNDGSRGLFPYFTTLSFGGGLHFGVPCRGALLGRVEHEGRKTSSDQYPKGP